VSLPPLASVLVPPTAVVLPPSAVDGDETPVVSPEQAATARKLKEA
jgi:hypothetical protein